jgi:hypothetical protein
MHQILTWHKALSRLSLTLGAGYPVSTPTELQFYSGVLPSTSFRSYLVYGKQKLTFSWLPNVPKGWQVTWLGPINLLGFPLSLLAVSTSPLFFLLLLVILPPHLPLHLCFSLSLDMTMEKRIDLEGTNERKNRQTTKIKNYNHIQEGKS